MEQLIPFLTASILLTLSPGPDIIFVMVQGISNGKKHGLVTAFGLATGIIIHTSLIAFGISAMIRESESIFLTIKIVGILYLLYLAYKVYKSNPEITYTVKGIQQKSLFSLFKQGFIMNVLNPKVTIFFLAFFPGFLWAPDGNTIVQFYILGGLFTLQTILIFSLVALLSGKISKYLRKHQSAGYILKWLQIFVFIGIAILISLP